MNIPKVVPEKGFYYHYKHNPDGEINNYAYEVIGTGYHTENNCRFEDVNMVVYLPLYESSVYKAGKFFDIRPLSMFMESVPKGGKIIPRFQKIVDSNIILKLQEIRKQMYEIE